MTLYPLLSPRRREQVKKAIDAWKSRATYHGSKQRCPRGHFYDVTRKDQGHNHRVCRTCNRERYHRKRTLSGVR